MQPDPRMDKIRSIEKGGPEGGPIYDHKIGMYVMKGHELYRRKVSRQSLGTPHQRVNLPLHLTIHLSRCPARLDHVRF